MTMSDKSVLLFCNGIDEVISGSSKVAGIQVQMSVWAEMFVEKGWSVFSFTNYQACKLNDIVFLANKQNFLTHCKLSVLCEFFLCLSALQKTKPDLVLFRGASRTCFLINLLCRLFGAKFVLFSASDTDFVVGGELISGSKMNARLFRKSVRNIDCFVTQNVIQRQRLKENYGKDSLLLPNIWSSHRHIESDAILYDAVFVANIRKLKRVEWFLALASKMPDRRFALIGGANSKEKSYFEEIASKASSFSNLVFFGPKPFHEVNKIIRQSRILICTSEFEGFPNTFLQAWSAKVPVISTVNPSNVISEFGLGRVVNDEQELIDAFNIMCNDIQLYNRYCSNVEHYFREHHDAETSYERLMQFVHL